MKKLIKLIKKNKIVSLHLDFSKAKRQKSKKIFLGIVTVVVSVALLLILNALNKLFVSMVPDNENWALAFLALPFSVLGVYLTLFLHNQNKNSTYFLGFQYNETYEWSSLYSIKCVFESCLFTPILYIFVGLVTSNFSHLVGGSLMLTILLLVLSAYEYKRTKESVSDTYYIGLKHIYSNLSYSIYSKDEMSSLVESVINKDRDAERKIVLTKNFKIFHSIDNLILEISALSDVQIKEILYKFSFLPSTQDVDFTNLANLCFYDVFVDKISSIETELRRNSKNTCADEMIVGLILGWYQVSSSYTKLIEKNVKRLDKALSIPSAQKKTKMFLTWLGNSNKLLLTFEVYDRINSKILEFSSKAACNELFSIIKGVEENIKTAKELYEVVNNQNMRVLEIFKGESEEEET